MIDRWQPVVPVLDEFRSFLSEKVGPLCIAPACDRSSSDERWNSNERWDHENKGIGRRYGVYLIFDSCDALRYVGLSMNAFDDRIWDKRHYPYRKWTDVIAFEHSNYFLAPALECLLIVRLKPPENTAYCQHTVICVDADPGPALAPFS